MLGILPDMKNNRWTAKEVKALRVSLGVSQAGFSERLGVTPNYVYLIESGQKIPSKSLSLLLDCIAREVR